MLTIESLRLLGDLVLVDPDDRPNLTEGGIHIPETVARDNPNYYSMAGTVVKLGPGAPDAWYQCVTCERVGRESTGECPGCKLHLGGTNLRLFEHNEGKRPFSVKVGDRVTFNRFAGKQFEIGDPNMDLLRASHRIPIVGAKRMLVMHEYEILGTVDAAARIAPVYEAPTRTKITDGNRQGIEAPIP